MTSSLLSLVACVFGVAPHAGGPGQREGPALLGDLCPCRRPGEGVGHLGLHVRLNDPKLRKSELTTPGSC